MNGTDWRRAGCLVCMMISWVPGALLAMASSGSLLSLPIAQPPSNTIPKSPNGLTLDVDTRWLDGYGYRPIRVTVRTVNPINANRTITVRLKAGTWRERPYLSVDQDIELPAGARSASAVIAVPRDHAWTMVWWDLLVDGVFDPTLSLSHFPDASRFVQINTAGNTMDQPNVLCVGENTFSTGGTLPATGNPSVPGSLPQGSFTIGDGNGTIGEGALAIEGMSGMANQWNMASCSPQDLPIRWIDYTTLDAVVLAAEDLTDLRNGQPEAAAAILDWIRTGGTLWIHGIGPSREKLPRVEQALGIDSGTPRDAVQQGAQDDWLDLTSHVGNVVPYRSIPANELNPFQDQIKDRIQQFLATGGQDLLFRQHGLGILVVSDRSLTQAGDLERILFGQEFLGRRTWTQRHNMRPDEPNPDFAKFLIPGVGLAPIHEFRILITLFVLLIGPVNFWLLKRRKRLHLLVLSVPLAALAVTLALFIYAFFADGLGTRVRAHSLTLLDQVDGRAVCWARLSYYAGLAPSDGLEFSTQVAVYPIFPEWVASGVFYGNVNIPARAMQWGDQQYLTEGWLASRTPTQYLTIATRPSARRIDIAIQPDGAVIVNRLDAAIELLVVRGSEGDLYWGESIPRDAKMVLEPVAESEATIRIRKVLSDHELQFPEGYQESYRGRAYRISRSYYDREAYPDLEGNLMDWYLSALVAPGGSPNRLLHIDHGTYLAITRTGPEVEMGVADYREESSFHVLVGTWDR